MNGQPELKGFSIIWLKATFLPCFDGFARFSVGDVERLGQLGEALVDVSLFKKKKKNIL